MAVGLEQPRNIQPVSGVRIGTADAGIRRSTGEDLAVFEISADSTIAGVFTKNCARAAPVERAIQHLDEKCVRNSGQIRAMVVNSGNANAGVGAAGVQDCLQVCQLVASELGVSVESVLPFSTGVIGERLPMRKFEDFVDSCVDSLSEDNWLGAARAIMTTDTVPKAISKSVEFDTNNRFTITGIAKGSGMIQPNMATMLSFIATDAAVSADFLQQSLEKAVAVSFNRITVDGDTSTNDSCMLVATGESGVVIDHDASESVTNAFDSALKDVTLHLAQAIVRDGEGATKFVTIQVTGAKRESDCEQVARTIANSPLVKTALHASDPNWGRIYAAIGRSNVENLDMSSVGISIDDIEVMKNGALSPDYREQDAIDVMSRAEFSIFVDLGLSEYNTATVWTCDLSAEYVRINAEYRT